MVERVIPVFEAAGDERGLCSALRLRGWHNWIEARAEAAAAAWEEAAEHARTRRPRARADRHPGLDRVVAVLRADPGRDGDRALRGHPRRGAGTTCWRWPTCSSRSPASTRWRAASTRRARCWRRATRRSRSSGCRSTRPSRTTPPSVEMLAGDPAAAERCLRKGFDALEEMGDRAVLSTTAAFLGETLVAQERDDEAERFAGLSAELAGEDDVITQAMWRSVRATDSRPAWRARGGGAAGAAGRVARRADGLPQSPGRGAGRARPGPRSARAPRRGASGFRGGA